MRPLVLEVLTRARARIAAPENWTKGLAVTQWPAGGRAYCAAGAIWSVGGVWSVGDLDGQPPESLAMGALRDALPSPAVSSVVTFNDDPGTTHGDVLALYDRAIQSERERVD